MGYVAVLLEVRVADHRFNSDHPRMNQTNPNKFTFRPTMSERREDGRNLFFEPVFDLHIIQTGLLATNMDLFAMTAKDLTYFPFSSLFESRF
jgi:hypothetical protein